MHRKVAAALVAALALVAAGCGSSEPLTRAQLVRRIEIACREGQRETQAATRNRGGSQNEQQLRFATALRDAQERVAEELDGLEPPDEAKDDFDTFKQAIEDRTELIDRVVSDSGNDFRAALRSVEGEVAVVGRRLEESARALKVDGCV